MALELEALAEIADLAGAAIMAIYRDPVPFTLKADLSPLTAADLAAHEIIKRELSALTPDIPQLSEEGAELPLAVRQSWTRFWLIDPLDGTREFIKRNDEFTVNIALIENARVTLSVILAPALNELMLARRNDGVWQRIDGVLKRVESSHPHDRAAPLRVACSRSHPGSRLTAWLDTIGPYTLKPAGSSLKFMKIARGEADVYPRLGPTSQWDTAAGQLLLEETGGQVFDLHGSALTYRQRESLLNPDFLALGAHARTRPLFALS